MFLRIKITNLRKVIFDVIHLCYFKNKESLGINKESMRLMK